MSRTSRGEIKAGTMNGSLPSVCLIGFWKVAARESSVALFNATAGESEIGTTAALTTADATSKKAGNKGFRYHISKVRGHPN